MDKIYFRFPYDIHLLRGQSVNLDALLERENPNGPETISFQPQFLNVSGASPLHVGFGITLNTDTGEISTESSETYASDDPRTEQVFNFIVKVAADDDDHRERTTSIRIHVHNRIEDIVISPETITVHQEYPSNCFSLRARYDDGVEAVIGPWHRYNFDGPYPYQMEPVEYDFHADFQIEWQAPETSGLIDEDGYIFPTTSHPTGSYAVEARLTYAEHDYWAEGHIVVLDTLTGLHPIQAERIPSRSAENPPPLESAINVLIVADGFTESQRSHFESITNHLVDDLGRGKISSPFDILQPSMNFWRVFMPSRESGATHHREGYIHEKDDDTIKIKFAPNPEEPQGLDDDEWKLKHVLWHAGLPVPDDLEMSDASVRQRWQNTTLLSAAEIESLIDAGWATRWKKLGRRLLPAERDTFFGVQVNDHTAVTRYRKYNRLHFNPNRFFREDFDRFLHTLEDNDGIPVGTQFTRDSDASLGITRGKDFDRIAFLTPAKYGRANNFHGGFFCRTTKNSDTAWPNHRQSDFDWTDFARTLPLECKGTLVHELGHSLGLGDEYGETPPDPDWRDSPTTASGVASWEYAAFNGSASDFDTYGNIMCREDLGLAGTLSSENIKWRYHRIEQCAVLIQAPSVSDTAITCSLSEGQVEHFQRGNRVFLRRRNQFQPIADISRDGATYGILVSQELEVEDVIESANEVLLTPVREAPLASSISDFTSPLTHGDESDIIILYKPKTLPEDIADIYEPYARLLTRRVEHYLEEERPYAFNADADNEYIDKRGIQTARDLSDEVQTACASRVPEVVGLYTGGKKYHGNAYHATGRCIMRTQIYNDCDQPGLSGTCLDKERIDQFCAVCRYIITDMVDPTKHPETDRVYVRRKIDLDHR